jgi:hypothetical protein
LIPGDDKFPDSQQRVGGAMSVGAVALEAESEDSSARRATSRFDWIILPLIAAATVAIMGYGTKLFTDIRFAHSDWLMGKCVRQTATGPRADPNSVCYEKNLYDQLVEYRFNSSGDRTSLDCEKKPDGAYRIVLLGASNPMGLSVLEPDSLAEQLSADLSRSTHRRIEVYNAAMLGTSGAPELLANRMPQLMALRPDLILWVISSWDVNPDKPDDAPAPPAGGHLRLRDARRLLNQPKITMVLKGFLYRSQSVYMTAYMKSAPGIAHLSAALNIEEAERMRELPLDVTTIVDRAKLAGVPVVAVFLPNRGEAGILSISPRPAGIDPDRLNNELRTIMSSNGATYVDVVPELQNAPNWDGLYDPYGSHLNAEGHEYLAQILANALTGGAVPALSPNEQAKSGKTQ